MPGSARARLELVFESGHDFLQDARREEDVPLRFVWRLPEGRSMPPYAAPGELVSATIRLADREADFHVHLRVIERQADPVRPTIVFEFLPEERQRQELVLACAEGESIPYHRRRRTRVPCELSATLWADREEMPATCTVIGVGGMHVEVQGSLERLAPDALVQIAFDLEGRRFRVPGRVTSRIEDGPQRGIGIEFLFESARQRDEIAERVEALKPVSRHRTDR